MNFDPRKHLMNLQGKDYLPVAPRLYWFRMEHPNWSVLTSELYASEEQGVYRVECRILDEGGRVMSMGRGRETAMGFASGPYEKAETMAIGRALSALGYGTLESLDYGDDGKSRNGDTSQAQSAGTPDVDLEKRGAYRRTIEGYWASRTRFDKDFARARRRWDSVRSCLELERTNAPLRALRSFFKNASLSQLEAYRRHISRKVREIQEQSEEQVAS
jgi:hypothetical protein